MSSTNGSNDSPKEVEQRLPGPFFVFRADVAHELLEPSPIRGFQNSTLANLVLYEDYCSDSRVSLFLPATLVTKLKGCCP